MKIVHKNIFLRKVITKKQYAYDFKARFWTCGTIS